MTHRSEYATLPQRENESREPTVARDLYVFNDLLALIGILVTTYHRDGSSNIVATTVVPTSLATENTYSILREYHT